MSIEDENKISERLKAQNFAEFEENIQRRYNMGNIPKPYRFPRKSVSNSNIQTIVTDQNWHTESLIISSKAQPQSTTHLHDLKKMQKIKTSSVGQMKSLRGVKNIRLLNIKNSVNPIAKSMKKIGAQKDASFETQAQPPINKVMLPLKLDVIE